MTTATSDSNAGGRVLTLSREDRRTPLWERCAGALQGPGAQTLVVMALALVVRVFVIVRSHGMLDGDEAVLGIQAEQILHGAHPAYFAGQSYMGTWDAYLAAPLIALFGPSAFLLHAITASESLLLIPLMGELAARLFGERSRLPAMLFSALPPLYVAVGELRMLGGYVETLIIGSGFMLIAVALRDRWRSQRSAGWLVPLSGLLIGLGLWIDELVVYYLLACALWLLPTAFAHVRRQLYSGQVRWLARAAKAMVGFMVAAAIGATPAVIYALSHHGANIAYATHSGGGSGQRFPFETLRYYLTVAAPRVLGVSWIWPPLSQHEPLAYVLRVLTLLASALALGYLCWHALAPLRPRRLLDEETTSDARDQRARNAFALVLLLTISLVFWRSAHNGGLSLYALVDAAGRYALPLTTVMTLALARLAGDLPRALKYVTRHSVTWAPRAALLGLLILFAIPYALTSDVEAMQSSYFHGNTFPAQDSGVLAYLTRQHIRYVWTDHWLGTVVTYLDDGQVVCADYVDAVVHHGHDRFPKYSALVAGADRPSFLIESDPAAGEPAVARALDALGVTYTMARFGRLWVITPVSRTVHPGEILPSLIEDYGQ